ncbi:MAG: RtcB family protein [Parcubacteria group bacterium]|nr:RtcB family protein [Parcubacteria group bacterium]MCR4342794.1 RtcB family protein [Patescibacteria group bacterium]
MRVPARVFISEKMMGKLLEEKALEQVVNVATLPGIQKYSLAMPDIHWGYGFAVGGVAAVDAEHGVISPGGIGFDINCGVRLLKTDVHYGDIQDKIPVLLNALYKEVPSGVGKGGQMILSEKELDEVLLYGSEKMVADGYGAKDDLLHCESGGRLGEADASKVSKTAKARGRDQLGTIGAGNHFVEVDRVDEIYDEKTAKEFGLFKDQIVILIHCGSRGLGHQIATDYIRVMLRAMPKYGISLPDRQLAACPFMSPEGQDYYKAMAAGANFAWANRQRITWEVRKAWDYAIGRGDALELLYDVAHNIAKVEEYDGKKLLVHRKGATRAFPGQPVIIPGSMGTHSFVMVGQKESLEQSFGTTAHGAGRMMSRTQAKHEIRGAALREKLEAKGIAVRAGSISGLSEEAPEAYKDIEDVVDVVDHTGIARKVARLRPVAVMKG